MANFRGSGDARPSKAMSMISVVIGVGILITVGLFFVDPGVAAGFFVILWFVTLVCIIGYHLSNAFGQGGIDHTQFDFQAGDADEPGLPQASQLPELAKLHSEGLISEEEYRQKRAEILAAKW